MRAWSESRCLACLALARDGASLEGMWDGARSAAGCSGLSQPPGPSSKAIPSAGPFLLCTVGGPAPSSAKALSCPGCGEWSSTPPFPPSLWPGRASWACSWQSGREGGWVWPQWAGQRVPGPHRGDSVFPSRPQPLVAAQSFQQEMCSCPRLRSESGPQARALPPLCPQAGCGTQPGLGPSPCGGRAVRSTPCWADSNPT